jgi:hypothetical protein
VTPVYEVLWSRIVGARIPQFANFKQSSRAQRKCGRHAPHMTIDVWMQHPTLRFLGYDMFASRAAGLVGNARRVFGLGMVSRFLESTPVEIEDQPLLHGQTPAQAISPKRAREM